MGVGGGPGAGERADRPIAGMEGLVRADFTPWLVIRRLVVTSDSTIYSNSR